MDAYVLTGQAFYSVIPPIQSDHGITCVKLEQK